MERSMTAAVAVPAINDALSQQFTTLANLTREEMIQLLEDEVFFDATFNTLPQAAALHQTTQETLQRTIALAQRNEALRPALEQLRMETERLFVHANELKGRWAHLEHAQREEYKRFTGPAQQARLRSATVAQEYESESLVKRFMEGTMDEEAFAQAYKESRKVYFKRLGILEKWGEGKVDWRG